MDPHNRMEKPQIAQMDADFGCWMSDFASVRLRNPNIKYVLWCSRPGCTRRRDACATKAPLWEGAPLLCPSAPVLLCSSAPLRGRYRKPLG